MCFRKHHIAAFTIFFMVSCRNNAPDTLFKTVRPEHSGIQFVNELNSTPELNIFNYLYYYNGAGVAVADFDSDGLPDVYFVGNQIPDRLYLNEGNFQFSDITDASGIRQEEGWSFGVATVDINSDGWMDIYLSRVAGYNGLQGKNLLFINQGADEKGNLFFKEQGQLYGLDISALGTQAGFFDYDLDGDLDAFLLNHSVYPNRNYGHGTKRTGIDSLSGDRLYENRNGYFVDVSKKAGIYQGPIGYGLDFSFGDINKDGFPDIYVGNDFFENDYLYLSNGDKTFREVISSEHNPLGHTSHFSMGNTLSDLNNDGLLDIVSLDMLPEDLVSLKSSGTEYAYSVYRQYLKNDYSSQFMQNTVSLNNGSTFTESAYQMGLAATEWSWGVLSADFDLDGYDDLYITNGIPGATNDMDYISFASQKTFQKLIGERTEESLEYLDKLPAKHVTNYGFKNNGVSFEDVSKDWFDAVPSFSNGVTYADFDADGDLDIVVNNINKPPFLFENLTASVDTHSLTFQFEGDAPNVKGIGTKIELYASELLIYKENYVNQTYLSSCSPSIVVGVGDHKIIDSVRVIWPRGAMQVLHDVPADQTLLLYERNAEDTLTIGRPLQQSFERIDPLVDFKHEEKESLDFDRDILIPYAKSNEGPTVSTGDVDGDGTDDLFIGGAKGQSDQLFLSGSSYKGSHALSLSFLKNEISETTASHFFDADADGDLDLLLGYGGNEFTTGKPIRPLLLINENNGWQVRNDFDQLAIHVSKILSMDIDRDGDLDVVIASNTVTGEFGKSSTNHVFLSESGRFVDRTMEIAPSFLSFGLIEDIDVVDIDQNGFEDLVVGGNWTPIAIFYNDGNTLKEKIIPNSTGLWNTLEVHDFDRDGDLDIVAGNWGLNTRIKASVKEPLTLYRFDFDNNGKVDPIVSYYYKGVETIFNSKDELSKQLPSIKKRYLSYRAFAEARFDEIFDKRSLAQAKKKEVNVLASVYFENVENTSFESHLLPFAAQVSAIQDMTAGDFDGDGNMDLLLVGNIYELSTQIGRLDGLHGVILTFDTTHNNFNFKENLNITGAARVINFMNVAGEEIYVIGMNNNAPVFLKRTSYD